MALERKQAPKKSKQTRKLVLAETHIVEAALTRKDERGNLFEAVVNLSKGEVAIKQTTVPTTVKAEGLEQIVEFFTGLLDLVVNAPEGVVAEDADPE